MLSTIQYDSGSGLAIRLRDAAGKFWDFASKKWVTAEIPTCRLPYLDTPTLDDQGQETGQSLFTIEVALPPGGPWVQEAVEPDGEVAAADVTEYTPLVAPEIPTGGEIEAIFLRKYPAFAELDINDVADALNDAADELDRPSWKRYYEKALFLKTAHTLTLEALAKGSVNGGMQVAGGFVTSVSGAGVSTSFSSPTFNSKSSVEQYYSKTLYGQQFLALRQTVFGLGFMV